MKFSDIIEEISPMCECTIISNLINTDISAIKLIDPKEDSFDDNTLYFGYSIQSLKDIPRQFVSIRSEDAVSALDGNPNVQNLALIGEEDFSRAFNEANHIFERVQRTEFYNTMMETLNRVKDVDSLIDIASSLFGAALVLVDRDFRILSYSKSVPISDELWKHNIKQGFCDYNFIACVRSLKTKLFIESSSLPVEVTCPSSPYKKYASRVYCSDLWIGWIILLEGFGTYHPRHSEMLRTLSGVLGYAVRQYAPDIIHLTSEYRSFLYNLLIGADISSYPEAYSKFNLPEQMRVICCKEQNTSFYFPKENTNTLSEAISAALPGSHVVFLPKYVVIIGDSKRLGDTGLILSLFPRGSRVKLGISRDFTNIAHLKAHYEEAVDAVEAGSSIDPAADSYTFEDYGISFLFKSIHEHRDLSRYLHPTLHILEDYDRKNAKNYMATLRKYLENNNNIKTTAEELFLHRNTLIYRLNKIQEMCGISLSDTDTCFRLRISYTIMDAIRCEKAQ